MTQAPRDAASRHIPVLLDRCVELLLADRDPDQRAVIVDGTLGMGGHSAALLAAHPQASVIGIDRDANAISLASERLVEFGDRFTAVHAVYDELEEILTDLGHGAVDGILLDLGVSSLQIDEADRGFSYAQDAPLDMRMDPGQELTAREVVNTYPERELTRILRQYGEERFAGRIARRIVDQRDQQPIETSTELVDLIRGAIPAAARKTGGNPAKRTFQALRIEVNGELETLQRTLPQATAALAVGGVLVVMSYHSLEDRMVKHHFRDCVADHVPAGVPITRDAIQPEFELLTRGAELALPAEQLANPRSTSVRLRAIKRLTAKNTPTAQRRTR